MSTEHQKYSTENQADEIRRYANAHGMQIVRTYADEGKSGLNLAGREALRRLIEDVQSARADFQVVIAYDVSRWGRFQDADESAYYEYICRRAGVQVVYCAEPFENDGSPVATIVKSVKRAMAGEYSRELSSKVFIGQCRLVELGFRQGGLPGYGLRRLLIDHAGNRKGTLSPGEQKSLQTDRVLLTPGPLDETETVRRMYRSFVEKGLSEREIALQLNQEGVLTDLARPWSRATVHQVLTNEKYVGNNVYNHVSFKLKRKRVVNTPEMWVRRDGAFEPVVEPSLFWRAQGIIEARSRHLSDEDLLTRLRQLLENTGVLSGIVIDERDEMPSSSTYRHRFGSLLRAYQLIGYRPQRDYRYVEINKALRRLYPDVLDDVIGGLEAVGAAVTRDSQTDLLTINGEFTAAVVIAKCRLLPSAVRRWNIRFDTSLLPDITIVVRMEERNQAPLDYFLLPRIDIRPGKLRLTEANPFGLDAYRFANLDLLYDLAEPGNLLEAA